MQAQSAGLGGAYNKLDGDVYNKSEAPRDPEFQAALKKLSAVNSRLNELSVMAGGLADKVVGPVPESTGSSPKLDAGPGYLLSELLKGLDDASVSIDRVYRSVARLGNEF